MAAVVHLLHLLNRSILDQLTRNHIHIPCGALNSYG
jgi:hypothetical protein